MNIAKGRCKQYFILGAGISKVGEGGGALSVDTHHSLVEEARL